MAMVVQHNLTAMNSNRMLGVTTSAQAKSSEKLSSGYKINRAADDAAGLTISEKMRKQIRGLDRASTNAQDGVSAVQTAEGALTEVHSMLQRMNELAVQAANGTNSESDRNAIQAEIDQLTTEIDRVAETTKFNEIYLLKGNASGSSSNAKVAAHDAGLAGKLISKGDGTTIFKLDDALEDGSKIKIAGKEYTIGNAKRKDADFTNIANAKTALTAAQGNSATVDGKTTTLVDKVTVANATNATAIGAWKNNDTFVDAEGTTWKIAGTTNEANKEVAIADLGKYLKAGATVTMINGAAVSLEVVEELGEGELSTKDTAGLTALQNSLGEGDTITVNGKTQTVYDETATPNAAGVDSFQDVSETIRKLEIDGTNAVTINGKTYLVALETDLEAAAPKATREDIIDMIQEGDRVEITGGAVNYVYDVDEAPEDTITKDEAYRMIKEELAKASSIGADEGKEASVSNNGDGSFTITHGEVEVKDALSFSLHVGADADMTNKITVDIEAMSSAGLGVKDLEVFDESGTAGTYAIDAIADAIAKVSAQRSALGAVQNRLEHTIANLDNVVENTTAAESRIRDTDMAEEMVEYSKNNILAQAGQSMLAQANQSTQGVLSLLQ
ncbi:MAG: flagellar hook protein [Lachnospiraceae bacterium]|nr:flagellar hook protein [Lachnospiraceae bacterium]